MSMKITILMKKDIMKMHMSLSTIRILCQLFIVFTVSTLPK